MFFVPFSQQILGGGGTQHRVDIDSFLEQFLAKAAQIDLFLNHDGNNRRLAWEDIEASRSQFLPQQTGERGDGMAIAGLVLGYLGIGIWTLIIIALASRP